MSEIRFKGNNLQLKKNIEHIKTNDDLENNKIVITFKIRKKMISLDLFLHIEKKC